MTKIAKFIATLVVGAIALIENFFVSKIKSLIVQRGIRAALDPIKQTARALGDDNPRNEEQVEAIWKGFAHGAGSNFVESELQAAFAKIQDEDARLVLQTLAGPVVGLLRVVTDEDTNDKAQIKALVDGFLKSDATQNVAIEHIVLPLLRERLGVTNPEILAFIEALLREGLDMLDAQNVRKA